MKSHATMMYRFLSMACMTALICLFAAGCKKGPVAIATVSGDDGSLWEQVSLAGFGDKNNVSIVSMCEFQNSIYAVTRNDVTGFQIWRTAGLSWEQVQAPGFTDSVLHASMNNVWGDMIVFNDKLYVAVSSGIQGSKLYKSIGFEIWRYDGTTWEALVSHTLGPQVTGTITGIASCGAGDGSTTADFTDSAAAWTTDQFKGGILWITSGSGKGRVFNIVGNTAKMVTVQQNEAAATAEDTVCAAQTITADSGFPPYTIGAIAVGDSYKIIKGITANGFGELWNKAICDLEVYNGKLYAALGFNYEQGARIWKSSDGTTWEPSSAYSMGSYHGYDNNGSPTGFCLVPGQELRNGQPVSSSLPKLGKFTVDGEEILVVGGTGTQGCNGRGLRVFRLYGDEWKAIVDYFVDSNTTGTNENGMGDDGGGDGFFGSNFQAWSWAQYDGKLFTGIGRLMGGRIMYTPNADPEDGNWFYAVGKTSSQPDGLGYNPNIAFNIFTYDDSTLIAGTIDEESIARPVIPKQRGADLYWATGKADALTWTTITKTGFGDSTVQQFEASGKFFSGDFYISASSFNPATAPGAGRAGYTGAKVYRLASTLR